MLGLAFLVPLQQTSAQESQGWVSLFDGKTLSGWTMTDRRHEGRASGRSRTARSSAPARPRCSTAPRATTRTSGSAPRSRSTTTATRACTSAPGQGGELLQRLRGPGQQHPPRPDQDRLDLHACPRLQAARPARHLVHPGGRGGRQEYRGKIVRTSRSRSTASCSTSSSTTTKTCDGGPLRLPAARPGQQGRRSARSRSWNCPMPDEVSSASQTDLRLTAPRPGIRIWRARRAELCPDRMTRGRRGATFRITNLSRGSRWPICGSGNRSPP